MPTFLTKHVTHQVVVLVRVQIDLVIPMCMVEKMKGLIKIRYKLI